MAILFDFGGTLDADGLRWSLRFHAAYEQAGGSRPFERFEPLFQESDRWLAAIPAIRQAGFRETLEMQSVLLARLLADLGERVDPAALTQPVYDHAVGIAARNRPLLQRLAREHRMAIVSNFTGNLVHCLRDLDLLAPFALVVDSGAVGVEKPDLRMFRLALASLGADPATSWMVGDNPAADLIPAAALGLSTCWLAPANDACVLPPGVPTARIATLTQLSNLLETPCTV